MDKTIRRLASEAMRLLPKNSPAYQEARLRSTKPMDYLRYAEFPLALQQFTPRKNMCVMDIASPQWFSIFMAHTFPNSNFYYVNILKRELDAVREIANCLKICNIHYAQEDCRRLPFPDAMFDRVLSLSAIEHVAPDIGGDSQAFREVFRALSPEGEFTFSVPLKDERSLVYDDVHNVWERSKNARNFYMRNYDWAQLETLISETGFKLLKKDSMYERPGLLALEYWEGGPGKQRKEKNSVMKLKKKIDKLCGFRLESYLASRYLRLEESKSMDDRLINTVCTLKKQPSKN